MSVLKTKSITLLTIGVITLFTILFTGCGNKMPKKVYKINEITYSENGEIISENHPIKIIGNGLSIINNEVSHNGPEYDAFGILLNNEYFIYSYDFFYEKLESYVQVEPSVAVYIVEYNNPKKITVHAMAPKSEAHTMERTGKAIYDYDDSGRLVHYKNSFFSAEIWLQYEFWDSAKKNVKKVTWYSNRKTDINLDQGMRWIYQWDYFYNLKLKK